MSDRTAAIRALKMYPAAKKRNAPGDQALIRAVEIALADQRNNYNGDARLRMVDLFYWRQTHTIQGVAMDCHYSRETVQKWNRDLLSALSMALYYEGQKPGE